MNSKKANWLFLLLILAHLLLTAALQLSGRVEELDIIFNFLLSDAVLLVPAGLLLLPGREGQSFQDIFGFRRLRLSSAAMVVLFTFLLMPLITLCNAVSMLFVDNTVQVMSGEILGKPFGVMLFFMAVLGPFVEEILFRGLLYRGYRKDAGARKAVWLSALLFALMHLNFNQAMYAFVIGIALALLMEATDSIWSTVVCHMVFNGWNVFMMYAMERFLPGQLMEQASAKVTAEEYCIVIGIYSVLATVTTGVAACVLVWIAGNEGRKQQLQAVFGGKEKAGRKVFGLPLLAGIILALGYMVFLEM